MSSQATFNDLHLCTASSPPALVPSGPRAHPFQCPSSPRFHSYAAKPALAEAWGVVTYAELGDLIGKASSALTQLKLDRPTAFGLIDEHGPGSTAWLPALAEAGHFVALRSGNAEEHLAKLALINAQWVIASAPEYKSLRAAIRLACLSRLARLKIPTRVNFVTSVIVHRVKKTDNTTKIS